MNGWGEDPNAGGKRVFLITYTKYKINKTNKNYPVGEKQTGRLDKAGQGWTQDIDDPAYGKRTHTELQTKEIIKGANEEGERGKAAGEI